MAMPTSAPVSSARWSDKWPELYKFWGGRGAKFSFNSAPGFSFFPLVFSPLYEIPGAISLILGCVASVLCSNRGVGVYLAYLHCFQDSYIAPIFLCTSQSSGEEACIQSKYHKQNPSKSKRWEHIQDCAGKPWKGIISLYSLGFSCPWKCRH